MASVGGHDMLLLSAWKTQLLLPIWLTGLLRSEQTVRNEGEDSRADQTPQDPEACLSMSLCRRRTSSNSPTTSAWRKAVSEIHLELVIVAERWLN